MLTIQSLEDLELWIGALADIICFPADGLWYTQPRGMVQAFAVGSAEPMAGDDVSEAGSLSSWVGVASTGSTYWEVHGQPLGVARPGAFRPQPAQPVVQAPAGAQGLACHTICTQGSQADPGLASQVSSLDVNTTRQAALELGGAAPADPGYGTPAVAQAAAKAAKDAKMEEVKMLKS